MRPSPVEHIGDYGFLSDCRTSALVSRDGSVDWYSPGRVDAPSVFARLLDPDGGQWAICPSAESRSTWSYDGSGLILRTEHASAEGRFSVTDALAQAPGTQAHELGVRVPGALVRVVEGLAGRVSVELDLLARPGYADPERHVALSALDERGTAVRLSAEGMDLMIRGPVPLATDGGRITARFEVGRGDSVAFILTGAHHDGNGVGDPRRALDATHDAWARWSEAHQTYDGVAAEAVHRSAAVLQGLTYGPTGALLAAATTSLPERMGQAWNWDYRYAWLRDAGFTMNAQWVAACPDEPQRFYDWLARAVGSDGGPTQIVFDVDGERSLAESEIPWLRGFGGSTPVRVGNDAWRQRQLDVTGEVLSIAHLLRERLDLDSGPARDLLVALADEAAEQWDRPDSGMWEARDRERDYLSSKVMCWVALDRALRLRLASGSQADHWTRQREAVRARVLDDGWDAAQRAFTGAIGSDELDASVLVMPLVGFLGMDDERMRSTVEVIERDLGSNGLLSRWREEPNGFLVCSYWLAECHALAGDTPRAQAIFDRVNGLANDLGLLPEMADPETGEALGNVPQALSHAGLINAAWRLSPGSAG